MSTPVQVLERDNYHSEAAAIAAVNEAFAKGEIQPEDFEWTQEDIAWAQSVGMDIENLRREVLPGVGDVVDLVTADSETVASSTGWFEFLLNPIVKLVTIGRNQ